MIDEAALAKWEGRFEKWPEAVGFNIDAAELVALIAAAREREQLRGELERSRAMHAEALKELDARSAAVFELARVRADRDALTQQAITLANGLRDIARERDEISAHFDALKEVEGERMQAVRERDEARAELAALRNQRDGLMAQVELLAHERDEARDLARRRAEGIAGAELRAEQWAAKCDELYAALERSRQQIAAAQQATDGN